MMRLIIRGLGAKISGKDVPRWGVFLQISMGCTIWKEMYLNGAKIGMTRARRKGFYEGAVGILIAKYLDEIYFYFVVLAKDTPLVGFDV